MLPEELVAVYSHSELEKNMAKRKASMQQLTLKDKLSSTLMSSFMKDRSLSPQRAAQMVRESLGSRFSTAVGVVDRKTGSPDKNTTQNTRMSSPPKKQRTSTAKKISTNRI